MDTTENPSHKQSCSMHSAASSDEQVIRAHAEMLKVKTHIDTCIVMFTL